MTPFLKQVAQHYYDRGPAGLEGMCFIFPNRRSQVFFRKYLGQAVHDDPSGIPVTAPRMYTMQDFFGALHGGVQGSRVRLLLELYRCYSALRKARGLADEPLDEFIFWGDIIISDFNEVDKYRVDARSLYRNVSDLKSMQDDFSDLSAEQVAAIRQFISHFRQDGRLTVNLDAAEPTVKAGFLQIWQLMYPLYESFNEALRDRGLCYEGMMYRALADRCAEESVVDLLSGVFPADTRFVFVGLNALNTCERTVLRRMRDAGVADFCWDYMSGRIRHPQNMSSFFMERNVVEFPQAFGLEAADDSDQEVTVLSVPSAVGQAKQLPRILAEMAGGEDRVRDLGISTAVVLPDEGLLTAVLNSIPPQVEDVNVTMGYPMTGSAFHAFMSEIAALQMHLRCRGGEWYFYHRQVWSLLGGPVLAPLLDEDARGVADSVRASLQYYIPASAFASDPLLRVIFTPAVMDPAGTSEEATAAIGAYCREVVTTVAARMTGDPALAVELEFARGYYQALVSLSGERLAVKPQTWFALLGKLVALDSVHFRGEPMRGLQIMGPLETRALDFDNLVILSCNEGVFPRHAVSSSFIPHELRKAFDLPTYEYQDAVWAYYFYRMIQRPRRVWMVYDSRLEGVRSGEESRYIKQLEMHFGVRTRRFVAKAPVTVASEQLSIPKTAEDIAAIRATALSASSLQAYLDCPARFYYRVVKHLRDTEEVSESLDAGTTGNVFHHTMQRLYDVPGGIIRTEYLCALEKDKTRIKAVVREEICRELRTFEVSGRDLILEEVICSYVSRTVRRDLEMLREQGLDSLRILGLELRRRFTIDGFEFTGAIDRLDSMREGELRVVDYKTGKVLPADVDIDAGSAARVADLLFDPASGASRPKIALQIYLYDVMVDMLYPGSRVVNSVYDVSSLYRGAVRNVPRCREFDDLVRERLRGLLSELTDRTVPFALTEDRDRCAWCDFKIICGR